MTWRYHQTGSVLGRILILCMIQNFDSFIYITIKKLKKKTRNILVTIFKLIVVMLFVQCSRMDMEGCFSKIKGQYVNTFVILFVTCLLSTVCYGGSLRPSGSNLLSGSVEITRSFMTMSAVVHAHDNLQNLKMQTRTQFLNCVVNLL